MKAIVSIIMSIAQLSSRSKFLIILSGLFIGFFPLKTSRAQDINAKDFTSIQKAVNALPEEGGVVYIPSGIHKINEPIIITKSNVTLKGSGSGTILLNVNKEGKNSIELIGANNKNTWYPTDPLWHVAIQNMHLKGNEHSGNAIYARLVHELSINNLWIDYHGKSGIFLDHCYENARIFDNNIAYNRQTGISLIEPHDVVISANELEENGTGIHGKDVLNATITGNNIDDHPEYCVYFENTAGSIITGNMFEESSNKCVVLDQSEGVVVTGNTFRNAGKRLLHITKSTFISISGNTFDRSDGYAIEVENGSTINVTGNTFDIGRKAPERTIYGIVMNTVSNSTIADNTIINSSEGGIYILGEINNSLIIEGNIIINPSAGFSGIYLTNTNNSIISQNIIRDNRPEKTMKIAIQEDGNSNFNVISNNHVSEGIQGTIKITGNKTRLKDNFIN